MAHAQREEIVGVKGERPSVAAFANADGTGPLPAVPAAAFTQKLKVFETSPDQRFVRVKLDGQDLWLDRRALRLNAEVNAACLEVASSFNAPPAGAARGANGNCAHSSSGVGKK
ncbi:hypothetical protein [Hydrogenophaga sp.]|uniref:hypothetical protein n=1 Tax=Hydrogenophaga sp. TaxID=1904254 RepID=UPI00257D1074|nr:hypothetical protein [Hydrogenophaga sp.]